MPKQRRRSRAKASQQTAPMCEVTRATSQFDGHRVGQRILDPERSKPLMLVTIDKGEHEPYANLDDLVVRIGDRAELVVASPEATFGITDTLGDKFLSVFGGAGRLYPAGSAWRSDPRELARLELADTPERRVGLTDRLVADLERLLKSPSSPGAPMASEKRLAVNPQGTLDGVNTVSSRAQGEALGRYVLSPHRENTVVIVTTPADSARPLVDPQGLFEEVAGMAEIWVMPTGDISFGFADVMPRRLEVYGGAVRAYPPGVDTTTDPFTIPLRFVFGERQAKEAQLAVSSDVFRTLRVSKQQPTHRDALIDASGTVTGAVAGRALVTLEQGGLASVVTELLADVPADQVLTKGMRVHGRLNPTTHQLDISAMVTTPMDAVAGYAPGSVVLARTVSVERELVIVELFPDFPVSLEQDAVLTASRSVDLRTYISPGETVVARVTAVGPSEDDWELSLVDVGPADLPLPAPSLLSGGPAWLLPPPDAEVLLDGLATDEQEWSEPPQAASTPEEPSAPVSPDAAAVPSTAATETIPRPYPVGSDQRQDPARPAAENAPTASDPSRDELRARLAETLAERDRFRASLDRAQRNNARLDDETKALRTANREAKRRAEQLQRELEATRQELGRPLTDDGLFADPVEQLRFEVNLAWARRIPAAHKAERPLASFTVGPDFFSSWSKVQGIGRDKVVDVIVEVLTGIAEQQPGREVHLLRTGDAGNAPRRVRVDGAKCWRVSLQVNTPSARRLHYWRSPDGQIELSSVRVHDDMQP